LREVLFAGSQFLAQLYTALPQISIEAIYTYMQIFTADRVVI